MKHLVQGLRKIQDDRRAGRIDVQESHKRLEKMMRDEAHKQATLSQKKEGGFRLKLSTLRNLRTLKGLRIEIPIRDMVLGKKRSTA